MGATADGVSEGISNTGKGDAWIGEKLKVWGEEGGAVKLDVEPIGGGG
jgi:hypothetical protein